MDYDSQDGAYYEDVRETADEETTPYVTVGQGSYIGFDQIDLKNGTVQASYEVKAEQEISLKKIQLKANDSQKYSNDFESGDLTGWQNYEGSWNVSDGAYHGSGNGKSILESMSFSDFIYEVDICVNEATNWGGPVLRVTEAGAGLESYMGYCVNLNVQENAVWLSRHTNNWQHVANWPYDLEFNQTYHLRIVAEGPVITVYLDGEELGSYTDPDPYLEGYVGFRSYGTSLTMDNMSVRALGDKAPTITQEPLSAEILTGESAEFSVSAEGYEGARLTYQWQTSSNRVRWTDISGAESAVYRLENADLEQNGTYFRCIVSNEVEGTTYTAVSAAAELAVKGIPSVSSVTVTPEQASVEAGTLQRFTAKVEGENDPDTAVVWSVSGGTDGTRIEDGVLYVSADEPVGTVLTVTAASAAEPDIKATAAVTVLENTTTSENVQLYYEFDEGEGNEVKDYSSNSYNGMIGGTINDSSWTEEGFAFGGTNYLRLEDATLVSLDMTIVYRVKRTSEDVGTVSLFLGKNQSDYAGKGLWINSTSENAVFVSTDDFDKNFNTTGISTEDFYPLDEWVEVAVSVSTETGEYAIYRNGVEVETSGPEAVSVTVPTDSYNTIGMAGYDNEYLTGYTMGKYMILNKYISEGEALAICNGKFDPGNEEQNQPPTAGGDFTRQLKAGESIQLNADDLATDPDGDPLTIAAVTAEPDRSVAEAGLKEGVLTITAVAEGETSIKVSVSDGKGGTVQTEIGIIVSEIVDKSGLEALVEEAEQTEAELDRYADGEAKEKFVTALEQAYEILNSEADADSVRNAEEALKEAMQALREKAEKEELQKAIEKAEAIDLKQYTEDSVKAFTDVLKAAKEMYLDNTLSVEEQAEVDQMEQERFLRRRVQELILPRRLFRPEIHFPGIWP